MPSVIDALSSQAEQFFIAKQCIEDYRLNFISNPSPRVSIPQANAHVNAQPQRLRSARTSQLHKSHTSTVNVISEHQYNLRSRKSRLTRRYALRFLNDPHTVSKKSQQCDGSAMTRAALETRKKPHLDVVNLPVSSTSTKVHKLPKFPQKTRSTFTRKPARLKRSTK